MGVSAGLLASCEKAGDRAGRASYDLQRAARDRLDGLAAGAGELPLGLRARRRTTCGCSRPAAAPTCARRSSRAARCCRCTRANCSAARSAARWRRGTSRAAACVDEVGELVITEPMPSMPLFLWGDDDGERLRESYFSMYPGVWRHGDWIRITPRGGAVIYGRSDSTINRQGVRMGTSEIYRAAGAVPEVLDALVVDIPGGDGGRMRTGAADGAVRRAARRASTLDDELAARDQAAHPRGLLAAARAQRDPPDRGGPAHAVGQGAGGAGQAHPDGRRRRARRRASTRSPNPPLARLLRASWREATAYRPQSSARRSPS